MFPTTRFPCLLPACAISALALIIGLIVVQAAHPPPAQATVVQAPAAQTSATSTFAPIKRMRVPNGSFGKGTRNWRSRGGRQIKFTSARGGYAGRAARLSSRRPVKRILIEQRIASAIPAERGASYRVAGMVRVTRPTNVYLRVREFNGSRSRIRRTHMRIRPGSWRHIVVSANAWYDRSSLQVSITANRPARRNILRVDSITVTRQTLAGVRALSPPAQCGATRRGLPRCGAYFGATVGPQETVAAFEHKAGGPLAVRRSFYQANEVSRAVRAASNDIVRGRVPWISFKFPHTWAEMADGDGDAWARNIAARLAALDGPVWIAFHHEPENDGNIALWTRTQERLAPIVRQRAPNVAYSIIVTAFHQTDGNTARFGLDRIWPDTTIDLLGIDSYNYFGVPSRPNANHADLTAQHYAPIGRWARARGVPWAVAEVGYTRQALTIDRHWLRDAYLGMQANGGVAMAYFNSNPDSSIGDWTLGSSPRINAYAEVLHGSARWQN